VSALTSVIDDVDIQVERVARLIQSAQRIDREMAAGLGCAAPMSSVQSDIDRASAAVDALDRDLRKTKR
jgi:hypothetical protein